MVRTFVTLIDGCHRAWAEVIHLALAKCRRFIRAKGSTMPKFFSSLNVALMSRSLPIGGAALVQLSGHAWSDTDEQMY